MKAHNKETQATVNPAKALQFLKEGNQRFVNNLKINRNLLEQVNDTTEGQWPFAVILSCIDSRTSAELIFDQGLGDIFSVRIAGNILNEDILGSMEFACKVAGSKIIMVLGHSSCGAVKGAVKGVEMGNLTTLLDKIKPAVKKVNSEFGDVNDDNFTEMVEKVSHESVKITLDQIISRSPILAEMYEKGEIGMVSAYYSVETGEVEFIEERIPETVMAHA
ncbi:MAG: carbonic anhydrase [Saprospiraceae bacterium]|nr:carbonic anhydrase [Saprospiraceae bacterium]